MGHFACAAIAVLLSLLVVSRGQEVLVTFGDGGSFVVMQICSVAGPSISVTEVKCGAPPIRTPACWWPPHRRMTPNLAKIPLEYSPGEGARRRNHTVIACL